MVSIGAQVTLIDVSIAFLAGLLIIPAMYVAQAQGVAIFAEDGSLNSGPTLVFDVLPSLFDGMGNIGLFIGLAFFVLMSIAALTSSISMLEGPVSYAVERHNIERKKATTFIGLGILVISVLIVYNLGFMLDFVATPFRPNMVNRLLPCFVVSLLVGFGIAMSCSLRSSKVMKASKTACFGKSGLGISSLFAQLRLPLCLFTRFCSLLKGAKLALLLHY